MCSVLKKIKTDVWLTESEELSRTEAFYDIEVPPRFSEVPNLRSSMPHPKTDFSKLKVHPDEESHRPSIQKTSFFEMILAFRRFWVKEPLPSETKSRKRTTSIIVERANKSAPVSDDKSKLMWRSWRLLQHPTSLHLIHQKTTTPLLFSPPKKHLSKTRCASKWQV